MKGDEATTATQLPTDTVAALSGQAYLYWPKEGFHNGSWKIPPVKKI